MSLGTPKAGFASIGEFQLSALPFVTSSQAPNVSAGVLRVDFPKVTRFINVVNHGSVGNPIRIGFTQNGVSKSGNYYLLEGTQTTSFELRIKHLYIAGDLSAPHFSLLAGLTTIDAQDMPLLSGTLTDGSAGWEGVG